MWLCFGVTPLGFLADNYSNFTKHLTPSARQNHPLHTKDKLSPQSPTRGLMAPWGANGNFWMRWVGQISGLLIQMIAYVKEKSDGKSAMHLFVKMVGSCVCFKDMRGENSTICQRWPTATISPYNVFVLYQFDPCQTENILAHLLWTPLDNPLVHSSIWNVKPGTERFLLTLRWGQSTLWIEDSLSLIWCRTGHHIFGIDWNLFPASDAD